MGENVMVLWKGPLTPEEQNRRVELERIIAENFGGFIRVGEALAEINKTRLYRDTHDTFEAYARECYELSRKRAYQYIEASVVVRGLMIEMKPSSGGEDSGTHATFVQKFFTNPELPNESQARVLAKLREEDRWPAWKEVLSRAAAQGRKPTAKLVAECANLAGRERVRQATDRAKRMVRAEPKMSAEICAALDLLLRQINMEREQDWENTDQLVLAAALRTALEAVEA